MDEAIAKSRE